jgi:hypothetical protein
MMKVKKGRWGRLSICRRMLLLLINRLVGKGILSCVVPIVKSFEARSYMLCRFGALGGTKMALNEKE